jgi:hypothetical protein
LLALGETVSAGTFVVIGKAIQKTGSDPVSTSRIPSETALFFSSGSAFGP